MKITAMDFIYQALICILVMPLMFAAMNFVTDEKFFVDKFQAGAVAGIVISHLFNACSSYCKRNEESEPKHLGYTMLDVVDRAVSGKSSDDYEMLRLWFNSIEENSETHHEFILWMADKNGKS